MNFNFIGVGYQNRKTKLYNLKICYFNSNQLNKQIEISSKRLENTKYIGTKNHNFIHCTHQKSVIWFIPLEALKNGKAYKSILEDVITTVGRNESYKKHLILPKWVDTNCHPMTWYALLCTGVILPYCNDIIIIIPLQHC